MAKKTAATVRPALTDQKIVAPALEGKTLPEFYLHGEVTDESLTSWGEDLRDAWKKKYGGVLTDTALSYIAMYGPDTKLRQHHDRIYDVIKGHPSNIIHIENYRGGYSGKAWEEEQNRRVKVTSDGARGAIVVQNSHAVVTEGEQGGKRYSLFEHNISSVIRWMGKDGFTNEQVIKALAHYEIEVNPVTVSAQRNAGVKGQRGDPAALTPEQQVLLRKAGGK